MDDTEVGVIATLVIVVFIIGAYALGSAIKKESIAEQCDQFGAFAYQGAVYDCKRRVVGN